MLFKPPWLSLAERILEEVFYFTGLFEVNHACPDATSSPTDASGMMIALPRIANVWHVVPEIAPNIPRMGSVLILATMSA